MMIAFTRLADVELGIQKHMQKQPIAHSSDEGRHSFRRQARRNGVPTLLSAHHFGQDLLTCPRSDSSPCRGAGQHARR